MHKYNAISTADLEYTAPIGAAKLDRAIDLLELPAEPQVLDLAATNGEVLIRILEQYGGSARAVEQNPIYLARLHAEAATRVPDSPIELVDADPYELDLPNDAHDLVVCIDAAPFGDLPETIRRTWALVRSGGVVLLGQRFWVREPHPDYLELLGVGPDTYCTHADLVALAVSEGFTPLYAVTSSVDEMDHHEGMAIRAIERFLRASPGDTHAAAFRERVRRWRDGYLKWGRDTLAFGLYVLLK